MIIHNQEEFTMIDNLLYTQNILSISINNHDNDFISLDLYLTSYLQ